MFFLVQFSNIFYNFLIQRFSYVCIRLGSQIRYIKNINYFCLLVLRFIDILCTRIKLKLKLIKLGALEDWNTGLKDYGHNFDPSIDQNIVQDFLTARS